MVKGESRGISTRDREKRWKHSYFESESLSDMNWRHEHIELNDWLVSLFKPLHCWLVMIILPCRLPRWRKVSNINIPDDISLMGVDNDELICNLASHDLLDYYR